jgi:hypothetical protein
MKISLNILYGRELKIERELILTFNCILVEAKILKLIKAVLSLFIFSIVNNPLS